MMKPFRCARAHAKRMNNIARKLRKAADLLDTPGAWEARRNRIPLNLYRFFRRVEARGPIQTVLDVGASRGEFARYCAACFPHAAIHAFEPLPACQAALQRVAAASSRVRVHAFALGDRAGEAEMFQNDYDPSSSVLPMMDRHRELWPKTTGSKKISVRMDTLDNVSGQIAIESPAFMKLDVQGFELHVLQGAQQVLPKVSTLMMEVLFEPLYENQAGFRTILNFMSERGFRFVEFVDERRDPARGALLYADAAFARE